MSKDYWYKKHTKYLSEDWIKKPTIFAVQVAEYFPKNGRVLDLACGQGQDSIYFASRGYSVVGTDYSEFALDQAKSATPASYKKEIKYVNIDLETELPFEEDSFDVVYSHLGLHYFTDKRTREIFDKVFSIVKPGGVFATITNTVKDEENGAGIKIEENLFELEGIKKRFFSVEYMSNLTTKFKTILLDDSGLSNKGDTGLIRFIGRKV